ncbi:MAG TPA: hypothetical protein VGB30_12500 [bacterium]|jgi:hypothetical protein
MDSNDKIREVYDLFEKLDPASKEEFLAELVSDDNLLQMILDKLLEIRGDGDVVEIDEATDYISFLKKVKE